MPKLSYLFCIMSFLLSCNYNSTTNSNNLSTAPQQNGMQNIAEQYFGKLPSLFSKDMVSKAVEYDQKFIAMQYNDESSNGIAHTLRYYFNKKGIVASDDSIANTTNYYVELSCVTTTSLIKFKEKYGPITLMSSNTNSNQKNESSAKPVSDNRESPQQIAEAPADIAKPLENAEYIVVSNISDFAVWSKLNKCLVVFHKNLEFRLYANLGNEQLNKEKCIKLATSITNKI
jgi:hypothetical protein